jgi:hypothetical protein
VSLFAPDEPVAISAKSRNTVAIEPIITKELGVRYPPLLARLSYLNQLVLAMRNSYDHCHDEASRELYSRQEMFYRNTGGRVNEE